jgi:hypothetical protein
MGRLGAIRLESGKALRREGIEVRRSEDRRQKMENGGRKKI